MARFGNRERKKRPGQSSTRPMSRLPSRTDTVMGLSLIHISEPTRP